MLNRRPTRAFIFKNFSSQGIFIPTPRLLHLRKTLSNTSFQDKDSFCIDEKKNLT